MRRGEPVRGMSLVELLVAIAIIGALCCFLIPAAQSAREVARQAQCKNNLKQIALALQSYEGTWNVFPPSPMVWPTGWKSRNIIPAHLAMHALILPGVDHAATFNAINFQVAEAANNIPSLADPGINATAARTVISTLLCPSDAAAPLEPYGPTNYRANLGECGVCGGRPWDFRNGAFNRRGTRPADFTDGLSTTISLSEKPIGGAPVGLYTPMRDWIFSMPGEPFVMSADAWRQYCAGLSYSDSLPFVRYDGGRSWMLGHTEYTAFTTAVTPNSEIPDCGDEAGLGSGVFAARSYHPGSVQVAMADGSVRSVSNRVDLPVWRALGTRGKGELVSAGSY